MPLRVTGFKPPETSATIVSTMKKMSPIRFIRNDHRATLPTRGTSGSAGYDLYAIYGFVLSDDYVIGVSTGIVVEIPYGWQGEIRGRSSLSRLGITVHHGTIDSDYRGVLSVLMDSRAPIPITAGDRIAQLVITPCHMGDPEWAASITDPGTRHGGFGSTGT